MPDHSRFGVTKRENQPVEKSTSFEGNGRRQGSAGETKTGGYSLTGQRVGRH
jgi:hypothetical protein